MSERLELMTPEFQFDTAPADLSEIRVLLDIDRVTLRSDVFLKAILTQLGANGKIENSHKSEAVERFIEKKRGFYEEEKLTEVEFFRNRGAKEEELREAARGIFDSYSPDKLFHEDALRLIDRVPEGQLALLTFGKDCFWQWLKVWGIEQQIGRELPAFVINGPKADFVNESLSRFGTHPAGLVIADDKPDEHFPGLRSDIHALFVKRPKYDGTSDRIDQTVASLDEFELPATA